MYFFAFPIESVPMKIIKNEQKIFWKCTVSILHILIDNIEEKGEVIIQDIMDTSWVNSLTKVFRASYTARMRSTVKSITEAIKESREWDAISSKFWEYLISYSAQEWLEKVHNHKIAPISELWKEKKEWNHWFDFHSEKNWEILLFWESKYNATTSPYTVAINQIIRFIEEWKDEMDIADLANFFSSQSIDNFLDNKSRWFIAAFSLNASNSELVFANIFKTEEIKKLYEFPELHIIAIEIWK